MYLRFLETHVTFSRFLPQTTVCLHILKTDALMIEPWNSFRVGVYLSNTLYFVFDRPCVFLSYSQYILIKNAFPCVYTSRTRGSSTWTLYESPSYQTPVVNGGGHSCEVTKIEFTPGTWSSSWTLEQFYVLKSEMRSRSLSPGRTLVHKVYV